MTFHSSSSGAGLATSVSSTHLQQSLDQLDQARDRLAQQGQELEAEITQMITRLDRHMATLVDQLHELTGVITQASGGLSQNTPQWGGDMRTSDTSGVARWLPSQSQVNTVFARAVQRGIRGV